MDLEQLIEPQRKGWTATVGYDHFTGEPTDIEVNEGFMANSPFADNSSFNLDDTALSPEERGPGEETEGDAMIIDGLLELFPDIEQMVSWAEATFGEDIVDLYDDAVEAGDWKTVNEFLEQWSVEFREQNPTLSHDQVNQELDELSDMEPEGLETAFALLQQAEQAQDPIESEVLQMSAAFHKGDISAQDAIQTMLSRYSIQQLAPIYQKHNL